ncbi:MAG: hypothetical protein JXR96_25710, partial [Deltaproteobacteria bacterium]|nr:hypothetical protein [Deltaproteobacteria bacterium]
IYGQIMGYFLFLTCANPYSKRICEQRGLLLHPKTTALRAASPENKRGLETALVLGLDRYRSL